MFTDLSLQVSFGYALIKFTELSLQLGTPSGLGNQGSCKVYLSLFTDPMAGAKFTDLSLHITPYKEVGKNSCSILSMSLS